MKIKNRTLRVSIPRGSSDCNCAVIRDEENRAVAFITTASGSTLINIADLSDCTVEDESEKNAVCNPKTENRTPTQKKTDLQKTNGRFDTRKELEEHALSLHKTRCHPEDIARDCEVSISTIYAMARNRTRKLKSEN